MAAHSGLVSGFAAIEQKGALGACTRQETGTAELGLLKAQPWRDYPWSSARAPIMGAQSFTGQTRGMCEDTGGCCLFLVSRHSL